MGRIIFNADDLGQTQGVNRGILYAYQNGVVNSSSLMVTTDHFEEAVEIIANHKLNNIGLHFNFTEGIPILKTHQTLVESDERFIRNVHQKVDANSQEIFAELEAQYDKAIKAGVKINHIDSHHHIHMTHSLRKLFAQFSKKYNLPLRKIEYTSRNPVKRIQLNSDLLGASYFTQNFSADFYDENASEEMLIQLLKKHKGKSLEIMCHPGFEDKQNGTYNLERKKELDILTSDRIKELVLA
jgi:predicted glycoside hydrolase/deacetylase ChbG (UPF0249 family)